MAEKVSKATLGERLRAAWGEHGTWAILLTSACLGMVAAWPPGWISLATLAGLSGLAAAKVLAVRTWRREEGWGFLLAVSVGSGLALLPLLVRAPAATAAVGASGLPFLALYLREAREPRWTRTLLVETAGTLLLATSAGLGILASRPLALADAVLASLAAALLFLPGVPRVRLLKEPRGVFRLAVLLLALTGAATIAVLAATGVTAPWGALAALVFAGDLRAAWVVPAVSARHLGLALTLRSVPAALVLGLAWRPVA